MNKIFPQKNHLPASNKNQLSSNSQFSSKNHLINKNLSNKRHLLTTTSQGLLWFTNLQTKTMENHHSFKNLQEKQIQTPRNPSPSPSPKTSTKEWIQALWSAVLQEWPNAFTKVFLLREKWVLCLLSIATFCHLRSTRRRLVWFDFRIEN